MNKRDLLTLDLTALVAAILDGRLTFDWSSVGEDRPFTALRAHPALRDPAGITRALELVVEEAGWSNGSHHAEGFREWLLSWLAREGHPPATALLLRGLRADPRRRCALLAEAICAAGDAAAMEDVASTLDADGDDGALCAVFCLDAARAFDRLAPHVERARKALPKKKAAWAQAWFLKRLCNALARDGLSEGRPLFQPARHPRGWLAADERWIPLLVELATHASVKDEAKAALARVSAAKRAKPRAQPAVAAEAAAGAGPLLVRDGAATLSVPAFGVGLLRAGGGLLAVPSGRREIAVHALEPGLPLRATLALPAELSFRTTKPRVHTTGHDRAGVQDLAVDHRGRVLAVAGVAPSHDRVIALVDLASGAVLAERRFELETVRSLHFGPTAKTLWVAYEGEDGDRVMALDGATLRGEATIAIGSFPEPAWFHAHPHPQEDVGAFAVHCGQDGSWLKVVERAGAKLRVRKQALDAKRGGFWLLGYSSDGSAAVLADETQLALRPWPKLSPARRRALGGSFVSGVVGGDRVLVTVGEVSDAADTIAVFAVSAGEAAVRRPWSSPEATLFAASGAAIVTIEHEQRRLSLLRLASGS